MHKKLETYIFCVTFIVNFIIINLITEKQKTIFERTFVEFLTVFKYENY